MRALTVAALGAALLLPPAAVAQTTPTAPATPPGVPAAGYEMPGVPVGKPSTLQPVGSPVGTRLPNVGTQLPQATTSNPFNGNWPSIDQDLVVAPYPGMKKESADFWDRLAERWAALLTPPPPPPTKWIPGTTRRARERRERQQELLERRMRD
jgi:hypothetical protein